MGAAVRVVVDLPAGTEEEEEGALAERLRLLYVVDEVRVGRLSRAGAAKVLGMPITAFLTLAGTHGLPAFDHDIDDFERELASLAQVELRPGR